MKTKDENQNWMKIDFLEKMNGPMNNNPEFLLREIERIKIEKGVLGNELDKTKSLLQIQQQINEDQQKMFDEDKKILKYQLDKAMTKIEELAKLVDIERLPKDKTLTTNIDLLKKGLMTNNINELKEIKEMTKGFGFIDNIPDNITEFSVAETETEFGMNENALDIWFGKGFLEKGLEKELGFPLSGLMSFIAVDFYLHENQTSNLNNGMNPLYNLQLTFKVNVDEHFIHYLEGDNIKIDLYYISNNVQFVLGHGKIPLCQLLENEENLKQDLLNTQMSKIAGKLTQGTVSRVTQNVVSIFYDKDQNISIGKIHYKMRMRHPILEAIKWYREKDKVLREISPMHDLFSKKIEKEMKNYGGGDGKTMLVTIMISKAVNLKVSGPPRKISPYIYYQFYKFEDHYSETTYGENPTFSLVDKYNVIYDSTFHEYIENQYLELVILDDSNALEVQINPDTKNTGSVNLINNKDEDDLIGITRINLKDLSISNLIQGSFPIINRKNQISGEIIVNIFWEEIAIGGENQNDDKPFETKNWEKVLLKKFTDLVKHKGINLNSAFELLVDSSTNVITINAFKDFIQFTVKFTDKQRDIQELIDCVFGNKKTLNKRDFYKVFAFLLPHDAPIDNLLSSQEVQVVMTHTHADEHKESVSLSFTAEHKEDKEDKEKDKIKHPQSPEKSKDIIKSFSPEKPKDITKKVSIVDFKKKDSVSIVDNNAFSRKTTILFNHNHFEGMGLLDDSDRTIEQIVAKIREYMKKHGKSNYVQLFKMVDQDGNSSIELKVKFYF